MTTSENAVVATPDEVQEAVEFYRKWQDAEKRKDLATIADPLLSAGVVQDVATLDGGRLQRWQVRVPLYPKHQYLIKGRSSKESGKWQSDWSAGIRAEGYDWLNRVAGIGFYTPPTVVDREGRVANNPVHSQNYLLHGEVAYGFSETGQQVLEAELVEIDLMRAWQSERLGRFQKLVKPKSSSADDPYDDSPPVTPAVNADELLVRDPDSGAPKLGADGELQFRLPTHMEAEAAQRLITLQNFGLRMAKTIARRRLLMRMFAIRTLWSVTQGEKPELATQYVWVTGWRDMLTPDERLTKVRADAEQVFGSAVEIHDAVDDRDDLAVAGDDVEQVAAAEGADVAEGQLVVAPEDVTPVTPEAREALASKVESGVIPGVTKGMPGEKLAKAVCGARDVIGFAPCEREPGHAPDPHKSVDGVWPAT